MLRALYHKYPNTARIKSKKIFPLWVIGWWIKREGEE